jgi:hypothetical protein
MLRDAPASIHTVTECVNAPNGYMYLMPPRDARLCPSLEPALPAGSVGATGQRIGRQPREMLFGDGQWHFVTVRSWWKDRHGRTVVKVEWSIGGETYGESYLADPERIREA